MSISEQQERVGRVVARALRDAEFKKGLVAQPRKTLEEAGVEIPSNLDVRFVENTADVLYLTLPHVLQPSLIDAELLANLSSDLKSAHAGNTPKDVGCCGGGSSIGATWLEDTGVDERVVIAA